MAAGYTVFRIPLNPPQILPVSIAGIQYVLTLQYRNVAEGGWILDIADSSGNPIIRGIPLVTGSDLLAQYKYLGIPGELWVQNSSDPAAVPTFTDLGTVTNLYFVPAN